jgi:hypothetical protein
VEDKGNPLLLLGDASRGGVLVGVTGAETRTQGGRGGHVGGWGGETETKAAVAESGGEEAAGATCGIPTDRVGPWVRYEMQLSNFGGHRLASLRQEQKQVEVEVRTGARGGGGGGVAGDNWEGVGWCV